jgi:nitrite reductase (NO-forming)
MAVAIVLVAGATALGASAAGGTPTKNAQMKAGKALYAANCAACHQADGAGVKGEVPPLAGSDFLAKGHEHAIAVVLHGLKGSLKVHGRNYDSAMPQLFHLTNEEVADVLTYVYNSWGNPGGQVHASDVAAQRYDRALAPGAN